MKNSYLKTIFITLCFTLLCVCCQSNKSEYDAEIDFNKYEIDLGTIELNGDGNCTFQFSNSGDEPLIIQYVNTSCGCTVPAWPKKPIRPGKTGIIDVNYDTSRPGVFNKKISVFFNGSKSPIKLQIKGSVEVTENL